MAKNFDNAINTYQTCKSLIENDHDASSNQSQLLSKLQNNLGLAFKEKGLFEEATAAFTSSLVTQMLVMESNGDTAMTINNLASCHFELSNHDMAIHLFKRSLNIYESLDFTSDFSREMAKVQNNIGLCLMQKEQFSEALDNFQKYMQTFKGGEEEGLARLLNNMAFCYSKLDQVPKALKCYQQAYELQVQKFGKDAANEEMAMYLHNIGNCYFRRRSSTEALEHFQSALKIRKSISGEDHPSVANTLFSIGLVYKDIGHRRKSVENFEESLRLMKDSENPQDGLIDRIRQEINARRRFSIF